MSLNKLLCALPGSGNTGTGRCVLDPKFIVGAILLPPGTLIAASDTATPTAFYTKLVALAIAALPINRAYPIGDFEQITDNSEEVTIASLGYGGKYPVREGDTDWSFQFIKGALCLNKNLRKFNGQQPDVLFIDANGIVYGWKSGTNLRGVPMKFIYTAPFKINDGTNNTIYLVRFCFLPKYLNDMVGFVQPDANNDFSTVAGIDDVALSATRAAAVLTVTAAVGCASTDMYDLFPSALAVVGAWVARNAATGALITISSVAANASAKGWTVTLDDSDPDYTTGAVTISMADPAALKVLNVVGYESNVISVVIP